MHSSSPKRCSTARVARFDAQYILNRCRLGEKMFTVQEDYWQVRARSQEVRGDRGRIRRPARHLQCLLRLALATCARGLHSHRHHPPDSTAGALSAAPS